MSTLSTNNRVSAFALITALAALVAIGGDLLGAWKFNEEQEQKAIGDAVAVALTEQGVADLRATIDGLSLEIKSLEERIDAFRVDIKDLRTERDARLDSERRFLTDDVDRLESTLRDRMDRDQERIGTNETHVEDLLRRVSELQDSRTKMQSADERLDEAIKSNLQSIEANSTDLELLSSRFTRLLTEYWHTARATWEAWEALAKDHRGSAEFVTNRWKSEGRNGTHGSNFFAMSALLSSWGVADPYGDQGK